MTEILEAAGLSDMEERALRMHVGGRRFAEIAREMGRPYRSVKNAVRRGGEKLLALRLREAGAVIGLVRNVGRGGEPGPVFYDDRGEPVQLRSRQVIADDLVDDLRRAVDSLYEV